MREILFRGRTEKGDWCSGDAKTTKNGIEYIFPFGDFIGIKVIPETIGQFTGLTDKNGSKIFEGDIVKDEFGRIMEIVFRERFVKFAFKLIKITGKKWTNNFLYADMKEWFLCDIPTVEVIGNIHDNPELLK